MGLLKCRRGEGRREWEVKEEENGTGAGDFFFLNISGMLPASPHSTGRRDTKRILAVKGINQPKGVTLYEDLREMPISHLRQ